MKTPRFSELCANCGQEWIQHWANPIMRKRFCSRAVDSLEFQSPIAKFAKYPIGGAEDIGYIQSARAGVRPSPRPIPLADDRCPNWLQKELAEIGVYFDGEGEPYNKNASDLAARLGIAERTIVNYQIAQRISAEPSRLGEDQERNDRYQELKDFFSDQTLVRPDPVALEDEIKLYEEITSLEVAHTKEVMRHGVTLFELKEARKDIDGLKTGYEDQSRKLSQRLDTIQSLGEEIDKLKENKLDDIERTELLQTKYAALGENIKTIKELQEREYKISDNLEAELTAANHQLTQLQARNKTLRDALTEAQPFVENELEVYMSSRRGGDKDRQERRNRVERIRAALTEEAQP